MERYEAYKDSGVEWIGEIPASWCVRPIRVLATYNDETLSESTDPEYRFKYIDISSVSEGSINSYTKQVFSSAPSRARRIIRKRDVLVSTVRTYLRAIALVDDEYAGYIASTGFCVLRPKTDTNSRWFGYALSEESIIDEMVARSVGVSYPAINASDLVKLQLRFPPIGEQQAIADYLDAKTAEIDALVADCEREVGLLREYRKAVISEAVTKGLDPDAPMKDSGVEWIGEIPEGWGISTIGRIGTTSSGATPLRGKDDDYFQDATIPWVRTLDLNGTSIFETSEMITQRALANASCSIMPVGTVCVAMYGGAGTIGKCGLMAIPATTNQAVCTIVCNATTQPRYILYYLHAIRPEWMRFAVGTRKDPNISQEIVSKMLALVPPLGVQKEIANYLDAKTAEIDSLIEAKQTMADKLREYRKSLISEAVTGKFKVPGVG